MVVILRASYENAPVRVVLQFMKIVRPRLRSNPVRSGGFGPPEWARRVPRPRANLIDTMAQSQVAAKPSGAVRLIFETDAAARLQPFGRPGWATNPEGSRTRPHRNPALRRVATGQ